MAVEACPFVIADTIEFWAELTADVKESAGRTQSGNITRAGSVTLRWTLSQPAVTLCQCDARQQATRRRLVKRIAKPKANVALGRRLLRTLFARVRDNKPFKRGPARDRTSAANLARLKNKKQVA